MFLDSLLMFYYLLLTFKLLAVPSEQNELVSSCHPQNLAVFVKTDVLVFLSQQILDSFCQFFN
jgi:hypothetical protein